MAVNNNLKAWVRYDVSGRIVPGTLITQPFKPKMGNWKEIPMKQCCTPPVTGDFLLQEDGGFLLQEDGGRITL